MLGLRKTKLQGGRYMSKIPQSCSPVNARREFEVLLLEAEATLRRTIEVRLTALLVAAVCALCCASSTLGQSNNAFSFTSCATSTKPSRCP